MPWSWRAAAEAGTGRAQEIGSWVEEAWRAVQAAGPVAVQKRKSGRSRCNHNRVLQRYCHYCHVGGPGGGRHHASAGSSWPSVPSRGTAATADGAEVQPVSRALLLLLEAKQASPFTVSKIFSRVNGMHPHRRRSACTPCWERRAGGRTALNAAGNRATQGRWGNGQQSATERDIGQRCHRQVLWQHVALHVQVRVMRQPMRRSELGSNCQTARCAAPPCGAGARGGDNGRINTGAGLACSTYILIACVRT